MPKSKIQLNKSQKEAVEHKTGPLLVVAGAGTGKTRVITERIRHLIDNKSASPHEILALTFTDKASSEMLERLDNVMPLGYEEPWVYTFHSFADRLLKAEGLEIGLDPSYKIISYPEQWLLLRRHLFDLDLDYFRPLGNPTKFISAILKFISRLQDEYISVDQLLDFAASFEGASEEKRRWRELAHVYERYTQLKIEHSKMDFGDLITWSIEMFNQRPNILKKYQEQFKHVLVDEFQDTNLAQYNLVKLLCPSDKLDERSLLVVGDDSQSIYKFRGAAVSNILEFKSDYPDAKMLTLLENYRSTQNILDPSYKLIKNNNPDTLESKLKISKELKSMVSDGQVEPLVIQLETLEEEVDYTILQILEILGKEPAFTYKDIAILARANSHLDPFIFALRKHGLPYQLVGNRGLYDREEIRDLLALLRVIINPEDSISLYRVLNIDSFDLDSKLTTKLLSEARFQKKTLWEIFSEHPNVSLKSVCDTLVSFQNLISEKTASEFLYELVHNTGYLESFLVEETVENQLSINNLNLFLDKVKKFEVNYRSDTKEIPTIVEFLDYLELMIEAGENPAQAEIEDIDTINLLTVHASKGLEFPVVFMINLVSDRFPTRNRRDPIQIPEELISETLPEGDAHIQEERRLFYVGMTRAKKYLYMLTSKNYGGKREKKPSGYIGEIGLKLQSVDVVETTSQNSLFGVNTSYRDAKAVKSTPHVPYSLSYSKVSKFKTCPLQYKYAYVLNVPTPPSHALSFGITIHDTLRDFHSMLLAGAKVSQEDLLEIYENNWQPLGYLNREHQEIRFNNGKKLLEEYYQENKVQTVKPVALEKSFNIKIGGIKFFGRIDRIDPLSDGGVEIIDYKTGSTKSQKQVDQDDQVAFYALAAQEALGLKPNKLTYYFLEEGVKVSTTRTQEELDNKREEVTEIVSEMKKGDFSPKPGMHCKWCDYKDICPSSYKG